MYVLAYVLGGYYILHPAPGETPSVADPAGNRAGDQRHNIAPSMWAGNVRGAVSESATTQHITGLADRGCDDGPKGAHDCP